MRLDWNQILFSIGTSVAAALLGTLANELKAWIAYFPKWLVRRAAACLPEDQRERYMEEWQSHINEMPGDFGKIVTAAGLLLAAKRICAGQELEKGDISLVDALRHKKQIVLYGPPGTGKTHQAKSIAEQLIRSTALKRWGAARYFREAKELDELILKRISFVCGLHLLEGGSTQYRPGFLFDLIEEINREPANERLPYVLILDEINRTDLSRLLGKCFSLLEDRDAVVELPGRNVDGSRMQLQLPADLYVVGTMNLIDQSIEQIDFALRRRFFWFDCPFNAYEMLRVIEQLWAQKAPKNYGWDRVRADFSRLAAAATALNQAIRDSPLLGAQYEIGHTYFFDAVAFLREQLIDTPRQKILLWGKAAPTQPVRDLWHLALRPLLREYLSGLDANTRHSELSRLEGVFFKKPEPLEEA